MLAMRPIETAIIGAGPYGLSIAAHLKAKGLSYEIFGRPMESWRQHMPIDMMLRSEAHASNLWDPEHRYTFESFCRERGIPYQASGPPVSRSRFLDYAQWFQRRAVPDVQDVQLLRLSLEDRGLRLDFANSDTVQARSVVVATGHRPFRKLPSVLASLPSELNSHSVDHGDLARFQGKDVIVIGAGQSSLEIAALLHEQGTNVRILVRENELSWNPASLSERSMFQRLCCPEAGLGYGWRYVALSELPQVFFALPRSLRVWLVTRSLGPSGAWWLKDRVCGKIPVLKAHKLERASEFNSKVRLLVRAGARMVEMDADHVIAATGFKPDVTRLSFLDPVLMSNIKAFQGVPTLSRTFESSVQGLFFVGLLTAPTFGPVMRFMFGAKHVAPVLARRFATGAGFCQSAPARVAARGCE